MPLRVLHVTPFFEPAYAKGGMVTATASLTRWQARLGLDVSVYTTTAGISGAVTRTSPLASDGPRVIYFPAQTDVLFFSWQLLAACRTQMRAFDLVHIHGLWTAPGTWAARQARRLGLPYVLTPHGALNTWAMHHHWYRKRPYWRLLERHTIAGARCIHFTTSEEKTEGARWIGDRPAAVLPLGVEALQPADPVPVAKWRAALGIPPGTPLLGFLGRIHPKKGLDVLIRALAQVDGAHLVVAGPNEEGEVGRLRNLADRLRVTGRVHWLGVLGRDMRVVMLTALDIYAQPSQGESFGIAICEAMALGVPVVVTPGVNLSGAVKEFRAGCVVPRDPNALAEAISALFEDAALRTEMGAAGRRLVDERFDPGTSAQRMKALYEKCLRDTAILADG